MLVNKMEAVGFGALHNFLSAKKLKPSEAKGDHANA